jgi:hypothetical protein
MRYVYEVRPISDKSGVTLISEALPSGRLSFGGPNSSGSAVDFAKFYGRACDVIIRVYDLQGNVVSEQRQKAAFGSQF